MRMIMIVRMMMMMLQCTAARELVEVELSVSSTPVLFWLRPGFSLIWPWYLSYLSMILIIITDP